MSAVLLATHLSKVPKYLRKSELYLSFDPESDDEIAVPKDCLKSDPLVKSAQDLDHLLRTMRFWVLCAFPDALITFLLTKLNCNGHVLRKYEKEFPQLRNFLKAVNTSPKASVSTVAARFGRVDFMDYFARNPRHGDICDENTLKVAAQNGHLECLKFVHKKLASGTPLQDIDSSMFFQNSNIPALKYLLQHGMQVDTELCQKAAHVGSVPVLKYLLAQFPASCPDMNHIGQAAALSDQLACLEFAVGRGCAVAEPLCYAAIAATGTRCLQYLITNDPGVVLTEDVFTHTCSTGKLLQVQILHQHGCPVHPVKAVEAAAAGGSMQCLQFLSDLGFDCWLPSTVVAAARTGQIALVQELCLNSCPWDDSAIQAAMSTRSWECVRFLSNQCISPEQCKRPGRCRDCTTRFLVAAIERLEHRQREQDEQVDALRKDFDAVHCRIDAVQKDMVDLGSDINDQKRAARNVRRSVGEVRRKQKALSMQVSRLEHVMEAALRSVHVL